MNDDVSHLALVCGITVAINAVSAMSRGKDPIVTIVGGGLGFVSLSVVGGVIGRMDIATAVAYVFLVSAAVLRGIPLIRTGTALATNAKAAPATSQPAKQMGAPIKKG